jgi:hypothetical protein
MRGLKARQLGVQFSGCRRQTDTDDWHALDAMIDGLA